MRQRRSRQAELKFPGSQPSEEELQACKIGFNSSKRALVQLSQYYPSSVEFDMRGCTPTANSLEA